MKRNNVLTIVSLLAIILLSLHMTDDIVYGSDSPAVTSIVVIAILVIWLFGVLVFAGRRSGYIIMLLGSLAGIVVFSVHAGRSGGLAAGTLAASSGVFFFVWTLLALAVTSVFSLILAARGLWTMQRSKAPALSQ